MNDDELAADIDKYFADITEKLTVVLQTIRNDPKLCYEWMDNSTRMIVGRDLLTFTHADRLEIEGPEMPGQYL